MDKVTNKMMFSKKNNIITNYPWKKIYPLDECQFKDDDIFYYHESHYIRHNIRLTNFIDDVHWNHIKKNKSVKIIYENIGEPLNDFIIDDFKEIMNKKIHPSQIYIIVKDQLFKNFLIRFFEDFNFKGVNIGTNDYWLLRTEITEPKHSNYKFCLFSRHYKPWRLFLYSKLLNLDLLNESKYSFYNGDPYNNRRMISVNTLKDDLKKQKISITEKMNIWLDACPHQLFDNNAIMNPAGENEVYDVLSLSDFNLIIETHFYNHEVPTNGKYKFPVFLTEKTYKAIASKTPFLLASTPYSLMGLKQLGFKTFHPYINEDYDLEEDDNIRMDMVINEMNRICNLSKNEYQKLLKKCQKISYENLIVFKKILDNKNFNEIFLFFKDLVDEKSNTNIIIS